MEMTPYTYEYDFALLAAPEGGDAHAARAVLEALSDGARNADAGALTVLEDVYGEPIDKQLLKKLVGCRAILLVCSPRSVDCAEITQRLACFKKLGRQKSIIPLLIEGDAIPPVCGLENGGMGMAADLRSCGAEDFSDRIQDALPSLQALLGIPVRDNAQNHGALAPIVQPSAQLPALIPKDKKAKKSNKNALMALTVFCFALICLLAALLSLRSGLRLKNDVATDARVALSRVYRSRASMTRHDAAQAAALYKQGVDCLLPVYEHPYVNVELVINLRALGDSLFELNDNEAADAAYSDMCDRALYQYELTEGRGALEALATAQRHYARALMEWEDYAKAKDYCDMALAHAQAFAGDRGDANATALISDVCAQLGEIMRRSGDPDAAREALTQALVYRTQLAADGDNASLRALANAYYSLAENELLAGDYEAARRHFDQCLIHYAPASGAMGDEALGHYLTLSAFHAILFGGDTTKAVSDAEEAKTLAGSNAFTDCVYALALMFADRYQDSLAAFDALIKNGESARVQSYFDLLHRMSRTHPLMDEVKGG